MEELIANVEELKKLKQRLLESGTEAEKSIIKYEVGKVEELIKEEELKKDARQERVRVILNSISLDTQNKAIFRIENKKIIKSLQNLNAVQEHLKRESYTPNANSQLSQFNTQLYGEGIDLLSSLALYFNKYELKQYGRNNNRVRLTTELLYTVSPNFFKKVGKNEWDYDIIEKWTKATIEYMKIQFGSDIVYAELHLDESTPHIHAFVTGKMYHHKWKKHVISHSKHFGGKNKLIELQSNYANAMQREGFLIQRGLRGSKAKHKDVARWIAENKYREEQIKQMKNKGDIERRARNKVLRDLCKIFKIDPKEISNKIEKAENMLFNDNDDKNKK